MTSNDFSFAKFSQHAFYKAVNAHLLDMADLGSSQKIVDLACGTGGVTRQILDQLRGAKESAVIAIDDSSTALKQAMEDLKDFGDTVIKFVHSRVERVFDAVKEPVDSIVFCNAIHYIPDKHGLMEEISKVLKPGGKFVFNTSFYEGSHLPESLEFYRKWMFKAYRILRNDYGLRPEKSEKVEARKHLTPEQYRELVESHGFRVAKQEIETAQMTLEGWLDLSEFEDFIAGIMPGVSLDKASAALKEGLKQTFSELGITYVPRNWLEVVAVRV